MDRYPGADEAIPKCPYCQTIRFVFGSITTIRWCQSSVTAIIPFGQRTAREGRSSDPGPEAGPYVHLIAPEREMMSTRPGVLNPATSNSAVGEQLRVGRICRRRPHRVDEVAVPVEAIDPAADLRDQHAAVGERRRAVRRAERVGRVVVAARRRAVRAQDPVKSVDDRAHGSCGCRRPSCGGATGGTRRRDSRVRPAPSRPRRRARTTR